MTGNSIHGMDDILKVNDTHTHFTPQIHLKVISRIQNQTKQNITAKWKQWKWSHNRNQNTSRMKWMDMKKMICREWPGSLHTASCPTKNDILLLDWITFFFLLLVSFFCFCFRRMPNVRRYVNDHNVESMADTVA